MAYNSGKRLPNQGADCKLIGESGTTRAEYARDKSGNRTFVLKESTPRATGGASKLRVKRTAWSHSKIVQVCNFIMKDIERFIAANYAGPCRTDDGEDIYAVAVPYLVARHIARGRDERELDTMAWTKIHLPRLAADHPDSWFREAEQRILSAFDNHNGTPSIPDIDTVSRALRVTKDDRERCGLKHLPAVERPPAVRKAEADERKRVGERARRARKGAVAREDSISARQPWLAYGIGRRAWERRVARGEIPSDPAQRPVTGYETETGVILKVVKR